MIVTTEAIVLKAMKYRDTSKIVTFYTRGFGKLRAVAKGARSEKNKFGSALDPLSRVVLVLYRKEHRDLHLVSQCDLKTSYRRLTADLDQMAAALSCLELLDQTSHDEERNDRLFSLTSQVLEVLDTGLVRPEVALSAFKLRLASLLGFAPSLDICAICGSSLHDGSKEPFWFRVATGSMVCNRCHQRTHEVIAMDTDAASAGVRLSSAARALLSRCASAPLAELSDATWPAEGGNEIQGALRLYLHRHFDHLRPLKSEELFLNFNSKTLF